jgi:hypothetical protein
MYIKPLQPLQLQHLLSNKKRLSKRHKILFIHLKWCLHNAPSNPKTTGWWNRFNPSSNKFVIVFHKPRSTTSPTRQEAHQASDSGNGFPYSLGPQCNGDHLFLRWEDCSKWILVATHLFQLAPLVSF